MAKPPTDTAAEKLQMLDFLTTGAIDAGMIGMDDLRRFRRRLRRAKGEQAKAKVVDAWAAMIGERLWKATQRLRHRMPPILN